jgi:hypothetical protein
MTIERSRGSGHAKRIAESLYTRNALVGRNFTYRTPVVRVDTMLHIRLLTPIAERLSLSAAAACVKAIAALH